ncbi:type VI secretion system Vgr family protein, partial [Burkholderia vietnamiensis]
AVFRSPLLGNKLRFEDLKDHEGIRLATVFGQSSLNMGYLVDSEKNKRGEGFELTTKKWGTVRAPKGLFVSADAAGGSEMPHLDMPAAVAQLKAALQRVTDLAAATTQVKADSADRATQAALLDSLNQLRDAGLLASAPAGMAFVTPKSTQHSAGENVIVTAGQDMDVSVVILAATKEVWIGAGGSYIKITMVSKTERPAISWKNAHLGISLPP